MTKAQKRAIAQRAYLKKLKGQGVRLHTILADDALWQMILDLKADYKFKQALRQYEHLTKDRQ